MQEHTYSSSNDPGDLDPDLDLRRLPFLHISTVKSRVNYRPLGFVSRLLNGPQSIVDVDTLRWAFENNRPNCLFPPPRMQPLPHPGKLSINQSSPGRPVIHFVSAAPQMPSMQHEEAASFVDDEVVVAKESTFERRGTDAHPNHAHTIREDDPFEDDEMAAAGVPYRPRTAETARTPDMNGGYENGYTPYYQLPPLQTHSNLDDGDRLDPFTDDDPASYDLVAPGHAAGTTEEWSLEKRSQLLFSKEHLQMIFADSGSLLKFTSFLGSHDPKAVPILVHYLDALKALRAIHYANAIIQGLEPVEEMEFTKKDVPGTKNEALEARAAASFEYLTKEALPAYITYQYINIVTTSISARITGLLAPHLREASEGLAEVFCLTDPSRRDNPIVFASEEFNRTTQYGMTYIIGRNCRFLQGPYTNPTSVKRLRDSVAAGRQHQEVFLNYRRDGSPFMNLLMTAPLCDSRGRVRYFIGAQVDVSGLVRECSELESYQRLLELLQQGETIPDPQKPSAAKNDELGELAEMLNQGELATIRRNGGKMHREGQDEDGESVASNQPRLLLRDPTTATPPAQDFSGKLSGIYQHYLLVRPYPSLRILFASPSQRVPGILQSPFMNKIGGSNRVREELTAALADGRGVTAKVRWISKGDEAGRNKWIHCTPLIGTNGSIGVWMVVIVDDEKTNRGVAGPGRQAPPVSSPARSYTPSARRAGSTDMTNGHQGRNGSLQGSMNSFDIN